MANETDNLLDDVRAAATELATGEAPPERIVETPETPPGETAEQKAERVRDEQGRFAKSEEGKPRETLKLKEKPAEVAKPLEVVAVPGEQPKPLEQAKPAEEAIAPPPEWKGAGKVQWNKLPKAIQAELRETYEGLSSARQQLAPIEQAIAPHRDVLVRDAGSVENGIGQLMQFYRAYLDNPQGLIQHIARTRGIDLGASQGQPQLGTPQQPADLTSLIAQAVQQHVAPLKEQYAQAESQQTQQTIDAFAADPKHPYFQDVKVHMGQLLKAGLATDLPDAYDKAVKLNPAIWSQLEAVRTEDAKKTKTAEADKARRAAAASLRGSPIPGAGGGQASQTSSVHDDVRAAAAELAGA